MTTANILSQLGSAGVSTGFKNRIINGAMNIWQRGTSFSAGAGYGPDRWTTTTIGYPSVLSQSTSVPSGFQYSMKVQRAASSSSTTVILATQCIESNNCYDLSGQSVTFSFWAKAGANFSSSSSNLNIQLCTGTTADQGINYPYSSWAGFASPISVVQGITTTWTKYSFTATVGSGIQEAAVFFYYAPTGTAGADDAFYVTGVQLEVGTTATNFDYRPYSTELALCQRYYQKSFPQGTAPAQNAGTTGCAFAQSSAPSGSGTTWVNFPVVMRATPTTTTFYNPSAANSNWRNLNTSTDVNSQLYSSSQASIYIIPNTQTVGQYQIIAIHYTVDAEL